MKDIWKKYAAILVAVSAGLIFIGILIFGYIFPKSRDLLIEHQLQTAKDMTIEMLGILQIYQDQVDNKSMSLDHAKNNARKKLRAIRYGYQSENYFWVIDSHNYCGVHPFRPDLEGRDLSGLSDSTGKLFIEATRQIALEKDGGFVSYNWQWNDDPTQERPKIAFVHLFKPWNWIIGTGVYLDESHNEFSRIFRHLVILASILATAIIAMTTYLSIRELRADNKRNAAKQALEESKYQFRSFFHSNPEGIVLMDFDGNIKEVNKALEKLSGCSSNELIGRHFTKFINESDHATALQALSSIAAGILQEQPCELIFIKKNKHNLPILIRLWRLTADDSTPVSLGAFIHDLTAEKHMAYEKKNLQQQLFHAQKMESIGNLASGISHDFNNILSGIIGYTELALIEQQSNSDDKQRNYMKHVLEAANRAKDLVSQILKFSRPDQTGMKIISIAPLISESIKLLSSSLPTSIQIENNLETDEDLIMGDPTQIHQVIMNLCTNAYHAMLLDGGGVLGIFLNNVDLKSSKHFLSMQISPGKYLKMSITDTGSGIEATLINKIFEPYFSTKNINEGTGLGLSVTMGIVKGHSGLIEINSTIGVGTRFNIYFPIAHGDAPALNISTQVLPRSNGERILVVDDEFFLLDVIRLHLENFGYQVEVYQNSLEALKTFKRNPAAFDLVITDQNMPKMTGNQLIREIRRHNVSIPVILCSGTSETINELTAQKQGITKFIMKPISVSNLVKAVHETIHAHPRKITPITSPDLDI